MTVIYFNKNTYHLSLKAYHQLKDILPYWGLRITDDQQVVGGFSDRHINLSIQNKMLHEEISEIINPTDITLLSDVDRCYDFVINTQDRSDIIVKANNMTYHLKILDQNKSYSLQKTIHKMLWLPVRVPPIYIDLPSDMDTKTQSEYITYLIIQYLCQHELQPISHIPIGDYQYLIEQVLISLNPKLASFQHFTNKKYPSWPEPPVVLKQEGDNHPIDAELTPTHSLLETSNNKGIINNPPVLGPSSKRSITRNPINPFKNPGNKNSEPVNPFRGS